MTIRLAHKNNSAQIPVWFSDTSIGSTGQKCGNVRNVRILKTLFTNSAHGMMSQQTKTAKADTPSQILILSDIHCGELAMSERLRADDTEKVEAQLKRAASDIREALERAELKPSIIVVPGDLTSRGAPHEFQLTYKFVQLVSTAIGASADEIVITYGNHDVDWSVCRLGHTRAIARTAYCRLAATIGSTFAPGAKPNIHGPVGGSGLYYFGSLELLVLNSGIECFALAEDHKIAPLYPHGRIGAEQLTWLQGIEKTPETDGSTKIAIIHHHLVNIPYPRYSPDISLVAEGAEIRCELGRLGIDLVVHGHRHHPHLYTAIQTGWARPIAMVCAGSYGVTAAHRENGCIPNTFHVISLAGRSEDGNRAGRLHTFKQQADETWAPLANDESGVAVDAVQWFGSPAGTTGVTAIVESLVTTANAQLQNREYVELPGYDMLPMALRCQRSGFLNGEFSKTAKSHGLRMTGKFPDPCILTKIK